MEPFLTNKILDACILNGVAVVTTVAENEKDAFTASWFSQVSLNPVLLMVSIAKVRHSNSLIKKSRMFNINVLSEQQLHFARHFGLISGKVIDKFDSIMHINGKNGAPVLQETKAIAECDLVSVYPAGDHELFIGKVTFFTEDKGRKPLLFKGIDYW
jgi:flavin reductase (DIM6/NTAB) family NADH-FMN oxidoreductase RutF